MDILESRNLLSSFSLINNTLTVFGDNGPNNIVLSNTAACLTLQLDNDTYCLDPTQIVNVSILGNNGNDYIANRTIFSSTINGGNGDDYIEGGFGSDSLVGGNGDDVIDNFLDNVSNNTLVGGNGNDYITGGQRNDTLLGGNGKDRHYDILGVNYHDGGAGADFIISSVASSGVTGKKDVILNFFKVRPSVVSLEGGVIYFLPPNFATNTTTNVVTLTEDNLNYYINWNGVTSTFAKHDVKAFAGFGGAGSDNFINNTNLPSVFYGGVGGGSDTLIGGNGPDLLKGGGGDDVIDSRGGNDDVAGNAGNDTLNGGDGKDVVRIDAFDVVLGGQYFDRVVGL